MNSRIGFYIAVAVVGVLLLLAPFVIRTAVLNYDGRSYTPPDVPPTSMAVTPAPTITPMAVGATVADPEAPLRAGPVIVDLAHFNRLNRSNFQPLASALAERNLGLRFWLPEGIDVFAVQDFTEFPDQSEALTAQLSDASGLIVASPYFLWSEGEIAIVEQFVADGGRLVLISDPDVVGDVARDINNLAEPFGVVFNEDYLYDTVENDSNFTHIFVTDFLDGAGDLDGSTVAFYGARSIDGSGVAQTRTGETTVSSLRAGLSGFTTVAVAGLESNGSAGRVLALSDFDVLTEPYVTRFDNRLMVEHTANFLADGARGTRLVDFPAFLGKEVALVYGSAESVDSVLLDLSSQLQHKLETTGRLLTLTGTEAVTGTQSISGTESLSNTGSIQNLIYVSNFEAAQEQMALLDDFGVEIIEVIETPTPAPSETPTPTPTATATETATATPSATATETTTPTPSPTVEITGTVTPEPTATQMPTATPTATATETATITPTATATETPTPTPTPTPQITVLLEAEDGLRYLASETLVFLQQTGDTEARTVAVLGEDEDALHAAMDRLLKNDFAGCVIHDDLVLCPFQAAAEETAADAGAETPSPEETSDEAADATPVPEDEGAGAQPVPGGTMEPVEATPTAVPEEPGGGSESDAKVLIIDDDDAALDSETGEIHSYVTGLAKARVPADTWSIQAQGAPTADDVAGYKWIVWSGAGYAASGPGVEDLTLIMDFLNVGGSVTISSRTPFFGQTDNPATTIADIVTIDNIPALVADLPTEPVELVGVMPAVAPLSNDFEGEAADLVLRRGPASEDADSTISFVLTDEDSDDPQGAQLLIIGMSLSWLPEDFADTFIANMAEWMLAE